MNLGARWCKLDAAWCPAIRPNPEVQARVYAAFQAEAKLVAQLSDRTRLAAVRAPQPRQNGQSLLCPLSGFWPDLG
jgi:hypothetical protein